MIDKKLAVNFSSLLVSNFSVQGLRFLTVVLLSRKLGPELFGVYNYLLLLISLAAVVVEFGLKNYAIREFSLGAGSWALINRVFKIRAVVSLVSCIFVVGLSYQAFRSSSLVSVALIFSISLIVDGFLIDFVAIAQEKLHLQALGQILQGAFFLVGVFILLKSQINLELIAVIFTVSHLFLVGTYLLGIDPVSNKSISHKSQTIIWGGIPFLIAQIASMLQSQMDVFLLGQLHFSNVLGDYTACLKLLSIPMGVVNSLLSSLQPRLARQSGKKEVVVLMRKYLKPLVGFVLLMCLTVFVFGDEIIHLVFGDKYTQSSLYLFPLSLVTGVFIFTLLPMHALFVSKYTKKLLQVTLTNMILSFIVMGLTLHFKGPVLLPWAMLLVQIACCFQGWWVWKGSK